MSNAIVPDKGVLLGRAKLPGYDFPRIITVRDGAIFDITAKAAPTVRDVAELENPASYVAQAVGTNVGAVDAIVENSWVEKTNSATPALLSPIDLQAVKASGVTFVASLLERVIERTGEG